MTRSKVCVPGHAKNPAKNIFPDVNRAKFLSVYVLLPRVAKLSLKTRRLQLNQIKEQNMKKMTLSALALSATLAASSAIAGSCPMDMKQIDAAMATATLSMAEMDKVKALRAEGEKLHKSGKHAESVAVLNQAKSLLGI